MKFRKQATQYDKADRKLYLVTTATFGKLHDAYFLVSNDYLPQHACLNFRTIMEQF